MKDPTYKKRTYKEKQELLDKRQSAVKFAQDSAKLSLPEVLHKLIVERIGTVAVFPDGRRRIQCGEGRARSLDNMYLVAKSYIPGVTYKQVHDAVELLKRKAMIHSSYCNVIHKTVHRPFSLRYGIKDYRNVLK